MLSPPSRTALADSGLSCVYAGRKEKKDDIVEKYVSPFRPSILMMAPQPLTPEKFYFYPYFPNFCFVLFFSAFVLCVFLC